MGGQGFEVETQDLALLGQLFGRQQQHMTQIQNYVSDHCSASGAFTGVMSLLQGKYTPAHATAVTGFGQGGDIASACQSKITSTRSDLIETDRRQYEAMRALHPDLPPYQAPPGGGTLPPAGADVPSAEDDGGNAAVKFITETGEVAKRPFDATSAIAGHDPTDPRSHATPEAPGVDDYTSHSWWVQRGMDNVYQRAVDAYHEHRASGLPGGQDGSYAPAQADLRTQMRYQDAHARGGNFVSDHTGIQGHSSSHMPGTAYPSDSLRTGAQSFADNTGKVINIVQSPFTFADSAQRFGDSVELNQQIDSAANGPSNTGDRDWANSGGDDW